jgi:hypothetical protein
MLRPWEFYEYSFEEFILACRGFGIGEKELMKKFRLVGWAAMAPHVQNPAKSPESWMPLDGERTRSLTKEDALAQKQKLYDLGILRNN